eukprot:TRINITY_DN5745_c0_g1_i3.p1 TRINITY_DN5745_c0_g1~~TRINITY_DN5745_c0_g1_i3.p1  ORF type:complete len:310 (-),score=60.17 TRINITY_DN5745_c0_g1_i3:629-1558(-)
MFENRGWAFFLPFLILSGFLLVSPSKRRDGFRMLTNDEYAAKIERETFYGLYAELEAVLFVSASLAADGAPTTAKATQWHQYVLTNFWEKAAIFHAWFNHVSDGKTMERATRNFQTLFSERAAGNVTLSEFVRRFDVDVYRGLREPIYGELGRLMWGERLGRWLLWSMTGRAQETDGVVMAICQRYYYPVYLGGSFFMQAFRLALDGLYSAIGHPPRASTDVVLLNPRTLNPYFDYWWGEVFTPLNGMLLLLAVTQGGAYAKVHRDFFVGWNFARLVNAAPVVFDRLAYVFGAYAAFAGPSSLLPTQYL